MSRHTLADGVTPDPEITEDLYDEWWPELAPSLELLGDYYKRGLSWQEFQQRYLELLERDETVQFLHQLIERSRTENITLLCIEDGPEQCHRRLLAERCLHLQSALSVHVE